ncbi:hypothetical protein [Bradyrhizobium sp. BRP22]|nr:hypothetical protein [Bradyrhizobium sp. BRP22]
MNGNARRSADGAATDRGLNIAYNLGRLGELDVAGGLDARRNEHGFDLAR